MDISRLGSVPSTASVKTPQSPGESPQADPTNGTPEPIVDSMVRTQGSLENKPGKVAQISAAPAATASSPAPTAETTGPAAAPTVVSRKQLPNGFEEVHLSDGRVATCNPRTGVVQEQDSAGGLRMMAITGVVSQNGQPMPTGAIIIVTPKGELMAMDMATGKQIPAGAEADPKTGRVTFVFQDPSGRRFSADPALLSVTPQPPATPAPAPTATPSATAPRVLPRGPQAPANWNFATQGGSPPLAAGGPYAYPTAGPPPMNPGGPYGFAPMNYGPQAAISLFGTQQGYTPSTYPAYGRPPNMGPFGYPPSFTAGLPGGYPGGMTSALMANSLMNMNMMQAMMMMPYGPGMWF